jgi:very-short-patch-repair endonuclease
VVAVGQLRSLGLGGRAVRHRAASGRLHRIHRGVYAVGHRILSERGRWMAAVLGCGPEAVLSHRSAAALWGLRPDAGQCIDVSVPRTSARERTGIRVHATKTLRPADLGVRDGIPCTSVARTLLDLADLLDRRGVDRAVEQAEMLRLFDARGVDEVLAGAAGRRGARVLHQVIVEATERGIAASELEENFLALCRHAALPQPEVNAWLLLDEGAIKVDFLWRAEQLVVETDGRASHGTRRAFERDRRRDQRLLVAGFKVVRFTWRQVAREHNAVAATVGALLGR